MKLAFIADVHVANHRWKGGQTHSGVNARAGMIVRALHDACAKAKEEGCDTLVVCGDLFDNAHPEPQIVRAVGDAFKAFQRGNEHMPVGLGNVIVLVGNHDAQSSEPLDHSVASLALMPDVRVVQVPEVLTLDRCELWLVPYLQGSTSERLPTVLAALHEEVMDDPAPDTRVLALHAGIADENTAAFLKGAHDSVEMDDLADTMMALSHDIDAAFAGNWHDHRAWRCENGDGVRHIVQCGALVPTGFDNPGLDGYGSLIVYDTEARTWVRHEIPGPRFLTVKGDDAVEQYRTAAEKAPAGSLFVRWKAPASTVASAMATLTEDEVLLGLAGVEALVDSDDYQQAVQAATAAVNTSTGDWQGALRAYVDAMPLDESVAREQVFARALTYLTR